MPLNLGTESKVISTQKGPLIKIMSSLFLLLHVLHYVEALGFPATHCNV